MNEAGGTGELGIGARLRAGRERAGLTAIQAAERLHLDPGVLEALEREDFQRLGAAVYVRGHLRRYAELIGESAAVLQELYDGSLRSIAAPDLRAAPRADWPADLRKSLRPLAIGLGGFAIAGAVWWVLHDLQIPFGSAAGPATAGGTDAPPAEAAPAAEGAGAAASGAAAPADQAAAAPRPAAALAADENGRLHTAAAGTPESGTVALPEAAQAVPVPTRLQEPAPVQPASEVELHLAAGADSWVEVYDARGERLFYDVVAADSQHTLRGVAPLRITLGNAAGVALTVDGRPVAVPARTSRREARFIVNASGRLAQAR